MAALGQYTRGWLELSEYTDVSAYPYEHERVLFCASWVPAYEILCTMGLELSVDCSGLFARWYGLHVQLHGE